MKERQRAVNERFRRITTHLLILDFEVFVCGVLVTVYLHVGHVAFFLWYSLVNFDESLQAPHEKRT